MRITLEELDFTIRLLLENKFVELGYYPDEDVVPNIEAAIDALGASGDLVQVSGNTNYLDKGEVRDATVTVNRDGIRPAESNLANNNEYVVQNGQRPDGDGVLVDAYDVYKLPELTKDIEYDIRVVCEKITQEYKIYDAILATLPERGIMSIFELQSPHDVAEGKTVYIEAQGVVDLSGNNYIEKSYRYLVKDAIIQPLTLDVQQTAGLITPNFTAEIKLITEKL